MLERKKIIKIALAAVQGGSLLVLQKRGLDTYILPGGKPEPGETHLQTLLREVREDLGCGVGHPMYLRSFHDQAVGTTDTNVVIHLYQGELRGVASVQGEIIRGEWVNLEPIKPWPVPLASSLTTQIIPYMREVMRAQEWARSTFSLCKCPVGVCQYLTPDQHGTACRNTDVFFDIRVRMRGRWIPHFLAMLRKMEFLGSIGSTRNVTFHSDGDGDFRPRFGWNTDLPSDVEPSAQNLSGDVFFDAG